MSEEKLQQEIVVWFTNNFCLKFHNPKCKIFSIPNGGYRNTAEAINLKRTGLIAGVSDLIVLIPNRCIFIEVKTEIGKQSTKQNEFQKHVQNLGFEYYLVRNIDQFKKIFI
jgi:hypothetical protein